MPIGIGTLTRPVEIVEHDVAALYVVSCGSHETVVYAYGVRDAMNEGASEGYYPDSAHKASDSELTWFQAMGGQMPYEGTLITE